MHPNSPAALWPIIPGFIHYEQERYDAFLQWAEAGLARDPESPNCHEYRFIYRALHRDWTGAWPDWEYRSARLSLLKKLPPSQEWKGQPIPGKTLLILGEGGIGDNVMFSRWLEPARLAAQTGHVILDVREELRRWFQTIPWLSVTADRRSLPPFDFWISLESLPLATKVFEPFPVGQARAARDVKRVGICWHGSRGIGVDRKRSTDFDLWLPLLEVPGVSFHSLQYDGCPDERVEPLGPVADITDTAQRIADLDLVITVDTSIGHLAASMSVPVWMLHYRAPEWRWGLEGESAIWYRSMRIFRQERRGEWAPVFEKVRAELKRVARV